MTHGLRAATVVFAAALGLPGFARADVNLPPVLSSHMVLQRDAAVPIWGTAAPGEQVTVKFRAQEKTATAGPDGKWSVTLDPLTAGGPDPLTVAGKNTVTLADVLVGEVWVGSGQSNMAGAVRNYAAGDPRLAELAAGKYPRLRLLWGGEQWKEATPEAVAGFSAILFAFGVRLQKELDVPVGLMVGAVGGTPSAFWLSPAAYESDEGCRRAVAAAKAAYDPDRARQAHEARVKEWEKAAEAARKENKPAPARPTPPPPPGEAVGKIGHLYGSRIRPMMPFGIRGVLWDQGENGSGVTGVDQYTLMGALIRGWRAEWGRGEFPFLYVQKPSGMGCAWDPADPVTAKADPFEPLPRVVPPTADGVHRETPLKIRAYPNTFMVTASDLGSGIHPPNKSGYADRAARVALGAVYGKKTAIYGPTYKGHAVEGGKVRVSFDHVGQGLAFRHGDRLQGFAVAGADKVFHWADAVIDGDTVVLSSPQVAAPVAVRYAFALKQTWANLFNKDGLPALPFRTDDWK
jgi:sialate O-acetylesterase